MIIIVPPVALLQDQFSIIEHAPCLGSSVAESLLDNHDIWTLATAIIRAAMGSVVTIAFY